MWSDEGQLWDAAKDRIKELGFRNAGPRTVCTATPFLSLLPNQCAAVARLPQRTPRGPAALEGGRSRDYDQPDSTPDQLGELKEKLTKPKKQHQLK